MPTGGREGPSCGTPRRRAETGSVSVPGDHGLGWVLLKTARVKSWNKEHSVRKQLSSGVRGAGRQGKVPGGRQMCGLGDVADTPPPSSCGPGQGICADQARGPDGTESTADTVVQLHVEKKGDTSQLLSRHESHPQSDRGQASGDRTGHKMGGGVMPSN